MAWEKSYIHKDNDHHIKQIEFIIGAKNKRNILFNVIIKNLKKESRVRKLQNCLNHIDSLQKEKKYNDAQQLLFSLAGSKSFSKDQKCTILLKLMENSFHNLNNIDTTKNIANQILKHPNATPDEKSKATCFLDQCKVKQQSTQLLPQDKDRAYKLNMQIRRDHPRLFITKDNIIKIQNHLKKTEIRKYYEEIIKPLAKKASDSPVLYCGDTGLTRTPQNTYKRISKPNLWGLEAAACALVWTIENDSYYLEKAKKLLNISVLALEESYKIGCHAGDYFGLEVLYTTCAIDWIFTQLSSEEKQLYGNAILNYVYNGQIKGGRFVQSNGAPEITGFYGIRMLKWYAGLAFTNENINDEMALKLLYEGYLDHEVMLNARNQCSQKDGGFATTSNNYLMRTYLWSSFNYLQSYYSAIGINRASKMNHLLYFPNWCFWNRIPTDKPFKYFNEIEYVTGKAREFGVGDTPNTSKEMPDISMNIYEILHCINNDSHLEKFALNLVDNNPLKESWMLRFRPLTPILAFNMPTIRKTDGTKTIKSQNAYFFPNLGIAFFRSGSTANDTYACFVTNKILWGHRHYDANSFMIYKYDFLALDTGTRLGFERKDYEHLNSYYAQSVAHNTMLIHMPNEKMPSHWRAITGKERFFCHGGQNKYTGDKCLAFETNKYYSYIAGDATPVYNSKKCSLALRQFVFLPPNHFIIADRINSPEKTFKKEFLLHTQNEFENISSYIKSSISKRGKIFCKTIFPSKFNARIVGGKGHEFFASGKNWELPKGEAQDCFKKDNYMGRYRLEISPKIQSQNDYFLHVIEVGRDDKKEMIESIPIENNHSFGVELQGQKYSWKILFNKHDLAGGEISIYNQTCKKMILNQKLTNKIKK